MQRTVKLSKINYVVTKIDNGEVKTETKFEFINECNVDKAKKIFARTHKTECVLITNVETVEKLYKLDDDIFFKYAVEVTD